VPKHLEPLLDGTPLAIERIRLAWPALPFADRVYLLTVLLGKTSEERKALPYVHHRNQLIDLALDDENPYLRYLAANQVSEPFEWDEQEGKTPAYLEEMERFEKVESDSVELVRFAHEVETDKWLSRELDDPESFWKRTQIERLALVNGVKQHGEEVAKLLRYASKELLPENAISLQDVHDVLLQYFGWKTIAERVSEAEDHANFFADGWTAYSAGESVKALWEVIPDIPEELSGVLLDHLPERAGLQLGIPAEALDSLNERQLAHLLWRNDLGIEKVRRKIYKESASDDLRSAALASASFELLDADISELVYDCEETEASGRKKVTDLARLASMARGASLVQMEAICELLKLSPPRFQKTSGIYDDVAFGKMTQTQRVKGLSPSQVRREAFDLRLFKFATKLAPLWLQKSPTDLPSKLQSHSDLVVFRNPWETYLNLAKIVRVDNWRQYLDYLPGVYIEDFDLPEEETESLYAEEEASEVERDTNEEDRQQLFNLLEHVQEQVRDVSEQDRAELSALSKALSAISSQLGRADTLTKMKIEVLEGDLRRQAGVLRILLVIGGVTLLYLVLS